MDFKKTIEKIKEALDSKVKKTTPESYTFPVIKDSSLLSIDKSIVQKFPSISVGVAIIKGIHIEKTNPDLQKEINKFLSSHSELNNEIINSYPEVQSYRKLYKEMGVDWHSRRPSPEALLRRIAQKKGLYNVNTCVDAYNLIVMKHRVSVGAFDLDQINFPTILKHPSDGDEILLLGDSEPTKYKLTEIAYFDQKGGYNMDFNYRDAQRTAVKDTTKNILLNIDGVYDISRAHVEKTLKESIDIITKYCGGTVEDAGIVIAE